MKFKIFLLICTIISFGYLGFVGERDYKAVEVISDPYPIPFIKQADKTWRVTLKGFYTPVQRQMVQEAMKKWNFLVGKPLFSFTGGTGSVSVEFVTSPLKENRLGETTQPRITMKNSYYEVKISAFAVSNTLEHEFGHVVGFGHAPGLRSVMTFTPSSWFQRGGRFTTKMRRLVREAY